MGLLRFLIRKRTRLDREPVFDPESYRARYDDLTKLSRADLRRHWLELGLDSGRVASREFSAPEYLERYPDVAHKYGIQGFSQAARHFLRYGRAENRSGRCRDRVQRLRGRQVTLRTSENWGHSIWSLRWKGHEFVNSHDVGRGLTVAWQEDGLLEGRNPTEAGNILDSRFHRCDRRSTSRAIAVDLEGRTLSTKTQPAYWLPPGHPGSHVDQPLSRSVIDKRVTVDFLDNPHLIRWQVEIDFKGQARARRSQVQALSLFSYGHFRDFWSFDVGASKERLRPLPIEFGQIWDPCGAIVRSRRGDLTDATLDNRQSDEVRTRLTPRHGGIILSDRRGSHAIGLYGNSRRSGHRGWWMQGSDDVAWAGRNLPDSQASGLPDDDSTSFLSSVCRIPLENRRYRFLAYIAVGTMRDVIDAFEQLYRERLF